MAGMAGGPVSGHKKSELAGTRTLDHRLKRAMLYRLSYQPTTNVNSLKYHAFAKMQEKSGKNRENSG